MPQLDPCRFQVRAALAAAWMLLSAASAQGASLFSEDFESLTLGPFVSATEGGGDGTDWTATPPAGWVSDPSGTTPGGPAEFFGWTFLDKDSWVSTTGDQHRSEFTLGMGTVMVAEADDYDDGPITISPDGFNAFITTPAISLSGVSANSAAIEFASSWRPENSQKANLTVAYDGGTPIEILRWESDPLSPFFKADATNELVTVALANPTGASEVVVTFGMFEAGNDWWWAVDEVEVTGTVVVPEPAAALLVALALCGPRSATHRLRISGGPPAPRSPRAPVPGPRATRPPLPVPAPSSRPRARQRARRPRTARSSPAPRTRRCACPRVRRAPCDSNGSSRRDRPRTAALRLRDSPRGHCAETPCHSSVAAHKESREGRAAVRAVREVKCLISRAGCALVRGRPSGFAPVALARMVHMLKG